MPLFSTDLLYPEKSNLCLISGVEEIQAIGLPDHQQKVTVFVVSSMLALRSIEDNVMNYRESKAPTVEAIHAIHYSRRLEVYETASKVFAVPMEMKRARSRIDFMFRTTLTSWLCLVEKSHDETSKRVLSVLCRHRAGGYQVAAAYPSQWNNYGIETSW